MPASRFAMPAAVLLLLVLKALPVSAQAAAAAPLKAAPCATQPAAELTDASKAYAAGDFQQAESLYAAQLNPTPTGATYYGLVHAQLAANKVKEARASAVAAVAALPASADATAALADVMVRAGELAEAPTVYNKALALDHCAPHAVAGVAHYNDLISRHASAARQYGVAHKLAPDDAGIAASYLMTLPADAANDQRTPALKAFLAASPALPPAELRKLAISLALLEQHASCSPGEAGATAALDLNGLMLSGTNARSYGVKGRVGAAELPLLEVDSSVSGIVLNPRDAKAAGVQALAGIPPSPDGIYTGTVERVKFGGLEYRNCPVRVAPAAALDNSNSLIGTDFFADHRIRIDYVRRKLTLTPYPGAQSTGLVDRALAPDQAAGWTPAYISGGNFLLPTYLNKKGPYLFAIDTGAFVSIFAPDVTRSVLLAMQDKAGNIHGSSGLIVKTLPKLSGSDIIDNNPEVTGPDGKFLKVTEPLKVPSLRFAGSEFLEKEAFSFDMTPKSRDLGVEVSGLLGFSTLREFYIDLDYRNGLAKLAYDTQHLYIIREYAPVNGRTNSLP